MMNFLKRRRRDKLRARPFPDAWLAHLTDNVPFYARLSAEDQAELRSLIQVFVAEKNFEGCGGLKMTDEVRVTIAAQACLLLLRRETDVYPRVQSVLVYPSTFVAKVAEQNDDGVVEEYDDELEGEAWHTGAVILAWDDVLRAARDIRDGYNVVIHEFAHQLDLETGDADGMPVLGPGIDPDEWADVFTREYDRHCSDVDRGRKTLIDAYGADDPAEFFATATECFFGKAAAMKKRHGALYGLLRGYYRQDPEEFAR